MESTAGGAAFGRHRRLRQASGQILSVFQHVAELFQETVEVDRTDLHVDLGAEALVTAAQHLAVPVEPGQRRPLLQLQRHGDRKSTRLNSSHYCASRMPSSA